MPHDALPQNKRRNLVTAASVMLGFVLVFSALFAGYVYSFTEQLKADNRTRLAEVSCFISTHMTSMVSQTQEALQVVADAVSALDSHEKRLDYLRTVSERYSFAYMGFAGSDGLLYTTIADKPENILSEAYFLNAWDGTPTTSSLKRRILQDRAVNGIILAVPLRLQDDSGALVAMLSIRSLGAALQLDTFGGEGASYIIDRRGDVVMRTRSLDINNLFSLWRSYQFDSGQNFQQMQEQISQGHEGLASFVNHVGLRQYAYYHPLPFNGWMVVNVVPEQAVFGQTFTITRDMAILAGFTGLLFIGLMFWSMRSYRLSLESRSAAEAKSAFLANMSHEIRTPMNAIVGISEIMLRDELTSRNREQLLSIRNSGKGLLTIINDILDISKIESGGFAVVDETYELESLLYDLTIISVIRLGEKPVQFLVEADPSLPRLLVGDMGRVKQILLNIIGNAIKFTREGSIRVRLRADREGNRWRLTVEVVDTGIGIRQEDVEKLFVRFAQVDTRRNRNVEGTGLGLTISQKLCELMGGNISVSSEYGHGSTFTIMLYQGVDAEDSEPLVSPVKDDVVLLVCEPSAAMRAFEVACLKQLKVRYEMCETPTAFMQALRRGGHSHALAPRIVLRAVSPGMMPAVCRIELLTQQEHAFIESSGTSIYLPLLTTQLSCALSGHEAASRLRRHAGMEMDAIELMPYVSVLIVDDNDLNIQVAEGLLAPYGMRLRHAHSGREAIQMVQTQHFDLMLLDHMMPEMDGVETLEFIRSLPDERFRAIPVVALTANTTSEARQLFMEKGFNDFLAKPIETNRLNAVLMEWLKGVNAQRAAIQIVRDKETGAAKAPPVPPVAPDTQPEQAPAVAAQPEPPLTAPLTAVSSASEPAQPESAPPLAQPEQAASASPHAVMAEPVLASTEVDFNAGQKRLPIPGLYVKILNSYVVSTGDKLNALPDWMEKDPNRVVIEVHGLKSASASIGAQRFSDAARELELLGKEGNFKALQAGLPRFVAHGWVVIHEVEAYLRRL